MLTTATALDKCYASLLFFQQENAGEAEYLVFIYNSHTWETFLSVRQQSSHPAFLQYTTFFEKILTSADNKSKQIKLILPSLPHVLKSSKNMYACSKELF